MPPVAVHFNGGVNLPDTETVLRTLAERVPRGVADGEPGERAGWIGYQVPRLLATPGLERVTMQWDAAVETVLVDQQPDTLAELAGRLAALLDHVPDDVPAGLHLCYGDAGHVHMMEPESLAPPRWPWRTGR